MPDADIVFRGGSLIDGAGNPAVAADVAVNDGRVAAVGRLGDLTARRVVDVDGRIVCPGFVDMHSHSDLQILVNPDHLAKVAQGITTEVLGQDGLSYAPTTDHTLPLLRAQLQGWNADPSDFVWDWRSVGGYLDRLDRGIAANAAYLVPHATVRMMVMGYDDRPADADELAEMEQIVAQGMEDGAVGLSAGLTYIPGMYASDDELVALCRVVSQYGGYYAPHHRNYGSGALEAYEECIRIARDAGVPLHLTHAQLSFGVNEGRSDELLSMVDEARNSGLDLTLDTYPYLAGSTYLHAILPTWVQEGGVEATIGKLRDAALRERIRSEIEDTGHNAYHHVPTDWRTVVITGVREERNRNMVGRSIADVAHANSRRPIDAYCELLADDRLGASCVHHNGNEDNVRAIMKHPAHTGGSDGILVGDRPHPRGWGTFPRYLGRYVRELGVLRLEDAIRKFTSLPAQRLGFWDRGLVRPAQMADLVVFDPAEINDVGTYEDPRRTPVGIPYVMVNGELVIDDGVRTETRPGRALRRSVVHPAGGGTAS